MKVKNRLALFGGVSSVAVPIAICAILVLRDKSVEDTGGGWQTDNIPVSWIDSTMPPTGFVLASDHATNTSVRITLSGVAIFDGVFVPERDDNFRETKLREMTLTIIAQHLDSGQCVQREIDTKTVRTITVSLSPLAIRTSKDFWEPT